MRKIEHEMLTAIIEDKSFRKGNTRVIRTIEPAGLIIELHGNGIASINNEKKTIKISNGGWSSNTTKSRLNAIGSLFGFSIHQKDFQWYLNNKPWDGDWITLPIKTN